MGRRASPALGLPDTSTRDPPEPGPGCASSGIADTWELTDISSLLALPAGVGAPLGGRAKRPQPAIMSTLPALLWRGPCWTPVIPCPLCLSSRRFSPQRAVPPPVDTWQGPEAFLAGIWCVGAKGAACLKAPPCPVWTSGRFTERMAG